MRFHLLVVLPLSVVMIAGCARSTTPPPANAPEATSNTATTASSANQPTQPNAPAETPIKAKVDACALLTSKEIESIQGEAVKETKLSGQATGGLSVSQCFFTLPTFNNSVSLLVAQKGEGAAARDPKEFWRDTFHEKKGREREEREEKEEEESAPPKKVPGIGDEAFWLGSRVGGALYVLKGNSYVRVSIGGPADQSAKMAKSKNLAQKALARL